MLRAKQLWISPSVTVSRPLSSGDCALTSWLCRCRANLCPWALQQSLASSQGHKRSCTCGTGRAGAKLRVFIPQQVPYALCLPLYLPPPFQIELAAPPGARKR